MQVNFKLFFKDFLGEWLSQKNIYLLQNKKQKRYNNTIKISIMNNNYCVSNTSNTYYKYNVELLENLEYIINNEQYLKKFNIDTLKTQKINLTVNLNFIAKNLLKIYWHLISKNLVYEEYLYSTDQNLKICIGNLKNLKSNQYIAISVTSYIRLK